MPIKEVIEDLYHWPICPNCAAGLTEVDIEELEACSQCGFRLNPSDYEEDFINDGEDWEDDEILQMDHELIREELSK